MKIKKHKILIYIFTVFILALGTLLFTTAANAASYGSSYGTIKIHVTLKDSNKKAYTHSQLNNNPSVFQAQQNTRFVLKNMNRQYVTGQYSFTVSNISKEQKECQVIIVDENVFSIPLDIRIKKDGTYIVGSSTSWENTANYDSGSYLLDAKTENVYELEWKWDFEINDELNSRDTVLGKHARSEDEKYTLNIQVFAETAPPESSDPSEPSEPSDPSQPSEPSESSNPSQPSEPSGSSEPSTSTPSETSSPSDPDKSIPTAPDDKPTTGDGTSTILPVIFALVSMLAVIASTARKRKSK